MIGRANTAVGRTRTCPHCKVTILESATICPACQHHLQFNRSEAQARPQQIETALRVEGTIKNPKKDEGWEYSVVISIRNERGEEIHRQIVSVGAILPDELRTVTLTMDVSKPITADSDSK
ncbi:MAG TPA: hypothetical protein VHL14_06125 [Steroidobacteraceae bacterium]|jgi:uncharacterized Zn finger protein (UPF0148 family)|nr:hypothetical protein [Steroidobacteraceae bacterium]